MDTTVLLKAKAKETQIEQFVTFLSTLLSETRAFPGCININIYQNEHNPEEFTFYGNWESIAHYKRYLTMRADQGVMDTLISMLQTPPDIQYFKHLKI